MWINLHVHALNFHDFSLISNIFINIHEYANLIKCISELWMKVLCLNIQLVTSLKVSDELLLRYEYFCRDIPILKKRIMRCHETIRFHITQGQYFSPFRRSPKII